MRFALALASCTVFAWPITSIAAADFWVKDKTTQCLIWTDEAPDAKDDVTWTGKCHGGKASGRGQLSWTRHGKSVGTYEGEMIDGRFDGPGILKLSVEGGTDELTGLFKKGFLENGGLYKDAAGNVYEGEIKDGQPHGSGYQKIGEEEYIGEFEQGIRQGLGLALTSEVAYIGEFVKDQATGSGVLEDELGGRYHGQFKDGKPHGFGTYVTKEGAAYQGSFVDGKATGQILVTANADTKPVLETWKDGVKVQ